MGRALPTLLALLLAPPSRADPLAEARDAPRVRAAQAARGGDLRALFAARALPFPPRGVLLRGFKREQELELWGDRGDGRYALVKAFPICERSGGLGPKRREGDGQVPEGFYAIDHFNPASRFHLSLGISYPNASDRILGDRRHPGGAIYVHGACVTLGCLPMTDPGIELLYLAALEAREGGQAAIPVHLFPARLTGAGMERLAREREADPGLVAFWRNLKEGYDLFEKERRPPEVGVDGRGRYWFHLTPAEGARGAAR